MNRSTHSFETRYVPVPAEKLIRLAWVDECGHPRCASGRCIDISNRRIHVEVGAKIPLQTPVILRTDGISMAGSALVRYVTPCADTKFILVLDIR